MSSLLVVVHLHFVGIVEEDASSLRLCLSSCRLHSKRPQDGRILLDNLVFVCSQKLAGVTARHESRVFNKLGHLGNFLMCKARDAFITGPKQHIVDLSAKALLDERGRVTIKLHITVGDALRLMVDTSQLEHLDDVLIVT